MGQLIKACTVGDVVGAINLFIWLLHKNEPFDVKTADPICKDDFHCGFYIHLLF